MSKQANKTVIGIFVVVAIAVVVAAVLILGSGKFFKQTLKAVCYFEGSVGGLNIGAPVVFRGVKIGSVTEVVLRLETSKLIFTIPVYIEIEPDKFLVIGERPKKMGQNLKTFIDRGLRASLEMQSIVTGQMQVGLDIRPDKPAKFAEFKIDTQTPEIPTIRTGMQELTEKVEKIPIDEIFQKVLSAVQGIEKIINSPEITETVRSINEAGKEIKPLAANLGEAVKDVRKLVQNVDGQVGPLASNLNEAVQEAKGTIKNLNSRIGPLGESFEKTAKAAEATVTVAQKTLESIEGNVGENSPLFYQLNKSLEELRGLTRSIRVLADYLERHPESVIWGK
jgi:paraquat-inducible protein B